MLIYRLMIKIRKCRLIDIESAECYNEYIVSFI